MPLYLRVPLPGPISYSTRIGGRRRRGRGSGPDTSTTAWWLIVGWWWVPMRWTIVLIWGLTLALVRLTVSSVRAGSARLAERKMNG
jgi:hypothetical protein